uniref:cAMP regulated phosphoprotein 19 n=1 Tax=Myotis myotis TaxID=51298 RepID=A0A7J8AI81_MYOMY|nr:cAMP regulated phosphoprotein 19 [Myotis myotis]
MSAEVPEAASAEEQKEMEDKVTNPEKAEEAKLKASFTILMFWLSLIHPNYSFVGCSYLINLYCIDFFGIFLLDFINRSLRPQVGRKVTYFKHK